MGSGGPGIEKGVQQRRSLGANISRNGPERPKLSFGSHQHDLLTLPLTCFIDAGLSTFQRLSSGRMLARRHTEPATTGDPTLVPDRVLNESRGRVSLLREKENNQQRILMDANNQQHALMVYDIV